MKILYFIFPITGPNNGVKVISNHIAQSIFKNNDAISISRIDTSQAVDFSNFGKFSFKKVFLFLRVFKELFRIKRRDIVYMNITPRGFAFYRDLVILAICTLRTSNVTGHIHANGLENNIKTYNKFLFDKIKIIVINVDQKVKLDKVGLRTFLVPNSLPDYYRSNFYKTSPKEQINLIYLSNISNKKGVYRLQNIAHTIASSKLECKLDVYGGILSDKDKEVIGALDLQYDFFNYYGPITEEIVKYNALSKNDCLLFLSDENYEVYPLVYIEALMSGLAIITTNQIVSDNLCNFGVANMLDENTDNFRAIISKFLDAPELLEKQKKAARMAYLRSYSFLDFTDSIENIILYGI